VAGRRPSPPNPAGAHFLHDRALIRRLVRASAAGPGRLVLDLGAGQGAITLPLAATGARVVAVERDPRLAAGLRRRLTDHPLVTVVEADLREIPLPHREFLVVANIPFAATTALLRRLAGDPAARFGGAELIVAWDAARWLTEPVPRDAETAGGRPVTSSGSPGGCPPATSAPGPPRRPRTCPSGRARWRPAAGARGCSARCCGRPTGGPAWPWMTWSGRSRPDGTAGPGGCWPGPASRRTRPRPG
jgi:SAM-dependent methyltransferase